MKTGKQKKTTTKTKQQTGKRNRPIDNSVIAKWLEKTAYKPCKQEDYFNKTLYWFCQALRKHEKYVSFKRRNILIPCRIPFQTGEVRQLKISEYEEIFKCLLSGKNFEVVMAWEDYPNAFLTPLQQNVNVTHAEGHKQISKYFETELLRGPLNKDDHNFINKQAADFFSSINQPYKGFLPALSDGDILIKKGSDGRQTVTDKNFHRLEASINLGLHLLDAFRKAKKVRVKDEVENVDYKRQRKEIIEAVISDIVNVVFPVDSKKADTASSRLTHKRALEAIDKAIYRAEDLTKKAYTVSNLTDFLPSR